MNTDENSKQNERLKICLKMCQSAPVDKKITGFSTRVVENNNDDWFDSKPTKQIKCLACSNPRTRYFSTYLIILLISFWFFLISAIIAYFHPMYSVFGVGILLSRGAAFPIIALTMLAMFLVTYDFTTWCRKHLKTRCATLFDFQILFHRFSGMLITFYSIVNSIGHLTGSLKAIHEEDDVGETN